MSTRRRKFLPLEDDPIWFKDAIVYELHPRAYYDSDGDGVGDFKGLTQKLDYLHDLGITVLWLLPFFPSPLRDDGYDIANYADIHPDYGTLRDFKEFVREAHRRGLRVITELVMNHTSDQHPWFQRARRARLGSRWRDFYVWSDTPEKYKEARVIFQDFETSNWAWDPVAKAYYWHRFYSHQPDLNFDSPHVRRSVVATLDFWLKLGVDGIRLDAVPYLYERDGTICENLSETHMFLKALRRHVDETFANRMLLAEANQWPEDAAAYFGEGDECHMAFHFPIMPRLFMAVRMEDRFPIVDVLEQTPAIPENCQWAIFLRNHDELTLEMVTDEERDYMYRTYAEDPKARINLGIRRRLAPLLDNHRRRIELMTSLLFSLPGTPVLYYGDEIGMGNNIYLGDRNGVRTPMQWNSDRNAGFSRANSQKLYLPVIIDPEYHYESVNVEAQEHNPSSLLLWTKRFIALRKRHKAFGRGSIQLLQPENRKILAFFRKYQEECILVVANLSRYVQYVELDLSELQGMVPVEVIGRTEFPPIRSSPYFLSLGPHNFYWFSMEALGDRGSPLHLRDRASTLPVLRTSGSLRDLLAGSEKTRLEAIFSTYLPRIRWFRGKALTIRATRVIDVLAPPVRTLATFIILLQVEYVESDSEIYVVPLALASDEDAERISSEFPGAVLARAALEGSQTESILYDAMVSPDVGSSLLETIIKKRVWKGMRGNLVGVPIKAVRSSGEPTAVLSPTLMKAEQSNTSLVFGDSHILKLYRRLEEGINPDLEIGRFLSQHGFAHTAPVLGGIEYRRGRGGVSSLAVLQGFVRNQGDAWAYTLNHLARYFERVLAMGADVQRLPIPPEHVLALVNLDLPELVPAILGSYLESARVLGKCTAEMHNVLATESDDPDFAPEAFTTLYQRSLYQSLRNLSANVLRSLRARFTDLPEPVRSEARKVLDLQGSILNAYRPLVSTQLKAMRIRIHGDYHLGQCLHTGNDFVIMDFEGEPARPLSERKIKRSPLRDVAGMLRSFHYAVYSALFSQQQAGLVRAEHEDVLDRLTRFWQVWVSVIFLRSYLEVAAAAAFIPKSSDQLRLMLDVYVLDKAIYEVGYEMNNRPDWVKIPLQGIRQLFPEAD